MVFSGSLLLVAVVRAASLVSGRLLTGALGLDLLRRLDPPGTAASAVLGTAFCTLGFGWLSLFGLPAPRIALALAGTHLALLALCAYRGRLGVFRPRGPATSWAGLLGSRLAGHHDPLAVAAAAVPAGGRLPARPRAGGLGCPLVVARVSGGQRLRDGPP